MGGKLGVLFAHAGHEVIFSYSRRQAKLDDLTHQAGARASTGTPAEAANGADAILLAVYWSQLEDVLRQAGDLSGKVVLTCCVPLDPSDTQLVIAHMQSGAEALARRIPQAKVVAAFQTVPSEAFFDVFAARGRPERPNVVYCSNDAEARAVAASLIGDVGFDPVDAGPLHVARYIEPFAMLTAQLAYAPGVNPKLTYRFERYG